MYAIPPDHLPVEQDKPKRGVMDAADDRLGMGGRGGIQRHERGGYRRYHAHNAPARKYVLAFDLHALS